MSDNVLAAPMPKTYDYRVLERGPLWMWAQAELYLLTTNTHAVFLRGDWLDDETRILWGLSFAQRTVFSSRSLTEAVEARQEWQGMINAARMLKGIDIVRA